MVCFAMQSGGVIRNWPFLQDLDAFLCAECCFCAYGTFSFSMEAAVAAESLPLQSPAQCSEALAELAHASKQVHGR